MKTMTTVGIMAMVAGSVIANGCAKCPEKPVLPVYSANFAATNGFTFSHHERRTTHEIVSNASEVVLRFIGLGSTNPKTKDACWRVNAPQFAVSPNAQYAVRLIMRGDLPARGVINPGGKIEWFDAAGKPLTITDALGKDVPQTSQFTIPTRREKGGSVTAISKGQVPEGARRFAAC